MTTPRRGARLTSTAALALLTAAAMTAAVGSAPTARADGDAVYAPGSMVTLAAHVAGLDAPLAVVALAGLSRDQATAAVTAAEVAITHRSISLVAAPVHGKETTTKVSAGAILAKAPTLALTDPAALATAYSPLIRLTLDPVKTTGLAAKVTPSATVAPVDASARLAAHLILSRGYNGSTLDVTHLPGTLVAALGSGSAVLPEKAVKAEYAAGTLAKVIVVHTGSNRLQLFVKGRLAKTYVVATGQAGYPSPHGSFHVIEREGAPTWTNPHDPWSVDLPEVIGPGPDNPLGTRALQLDSPGILIHGIPEAENATLGQNASHGCVRMARSEIEQLYPQIPVGTPVLLLA